MQSFWNTPFSVKELFFLLPWPNSYTKRGENWYNAFSGNNTFPGGVRACIPEKSVSTSLTFSWSLSSTLSSLQPIAAINRWYPKSSCPAACIQTADMEGGFPQSTFKIRKAADDNSWKMHLPCQSYYSQYSTGLSPHRCFLVLLVISCSTK